jgi:transposase-like protein
LAGNDREFLRQLIRTTLQEVLEAEMTDALAAAKSERTNVGRNGYRSGYYGRSLITRVGKLELRIPQDRTGRFSTELFERYQRSERALVAALAEMYVQGVSTRKVKAITEELCGHSFSASSISTINKRLDQSLAQFAARPLHEAFPLLDRGCPLRARTRGRRDCQPGRADCHRHRLGRPPPDSRRRTRQSGKPLELERLSARTQGARA